MSSFTDVDDTCDYEQSSASYDDSADYDSDATPDTQYIDLTHDLGSSEDGEPVFSEGEDDINNAVHDDNPDVNNDSVNGFWLHAESLSPIEIVTECNLWRARAFEALSELLSPPTTTFDAGGAEDYISDADIRLSVATRNAVILTSVFYMRVGSTVVTADAAREPPPRGPFEMIDLTGDLVIPGFNDAE